jgi:hypothetical protein
VTLIRLLPLLLVLGLAACSGGGEPTLHRHPPPQQEPDGGIGGTGRTDCPATGKPRPTDAVPRDKPRAACP